MNPLRLSLTLLPVAMSAAAFVFFHNNSPAQIDERARYEAQNQALESNAVRQNVSIEELHKRAGGCPAPTIETEFFGLKRTQPDYGMQLECQNRVLYGDFYDPAYSTQQFLGWLKLANWLIGAVALSFALGYGGIFGARFAREQWWPWINGAGR